MATISPSYDQIPKDSDILTQGRYMGSTYLEVITQDWTYCEWIVTTSQQEASMPWINHFALYILNQQTSAMDAVEEEIEYPQDWDAVLLAEDNDL